MSLLGIDVGTSGCKAGLFSETGRLLKLAYREYDYQRSQPGWAELDTLAVWAKIQETIGEAAGGSAADSVEALSVSSLGEAVVAVDRHRRPFGPSLLNFDVRGAEYLPWLRSRLEDGRLYSINGNTLGNHYSLTKLLWLREHQSDLYRNTERFLHWSGFVSFMLGADPAVDYSLANRTLLFDLERRDWSEELLELTGLNRAKLPDTVASGTVIGRLSSGAASELGLPPGIPIVSGAHDQCCNGVGCGVIEPGTAMCGMGTYMCIMPVFQRRPEPAAMIERGLNTEHHAASGNYVSFIYNQGGALVKWFRDTFASGEGSAGTNAYPQLFGEMPEGPTGLMLLPHFTATGPPGFIDDSCGIVAGLKLDTSRGEILKAILEGTAFYLRECLETLPGVGIEISGYRAVGGGSQSDTWIQICADILNRPFVRPATSQAGALGAAVLAGVGSGLFPSLQEGVKKMVRLHREFHPNPETSGLYNERFEMYRRLWPLMADYLRELGAASLLSSRKSGTVTSFPIWKHPAQAWPGPSSPKRGKR
jgi:xylulokinase